MECQGGAGYCLHSVHVLLLPVCQHRSDNDIASDIRLNVRSLHDINNYTQKCYQGTQHLFVKQ